jgi:hypothetical protein
MNIFWVLSQGASRLHEPSMSAFLGYLLDSTKDHGLGDTFLRAFLQQLDQDVFAPVLAQPHIRAGVLLEQCYPLGSNNCSLDIEVWIYDDNGNEAFRLVIENKIRSGAANPKQLARYYEAVLEDDPKVRNLYVVFLTPAVNTSSLNAEFNALSVNAKRQHYAKRIYWDAGDGGVLPILRDIMSREMVGAINPINEYMRHTIKAFIRHGSALTAGPSKTMRTGEDIGDIKEEQEITLSNGRIFRVVMRDSTQVQVFDVATGDKQIARRVLAMYIDENGLPIPHQQLATRQIGKQFFDFMVSRSSAGGTISDLA